MPKIIDRDARRKEIVAGYLEIVAREGAEAATTRRLTQELGMSTGALWHYFSNFNELISQAYEWVFARTNERILSAVEGRGGLLAFLAMLEQIHPLNKLTDDEAIVVLNYWGRVAARPGIGASHGFVEQQWHESFRSYLDEAILDGELREGTPTLDLSDALLVLAIGYQVQRGLNTPLADPNRQWSAVQAVLTPWLTDLGRQRIELEYVEGTAAAHVWGSPVTSSRRENDSMLGARP